MGKRINLIDFLVSLTIFVLSLWAFLSGVNISNTLVSIFISVVSISVIIIHGGKVKIDRFYLLWIPTIVYMFAYAYKLSGATLAYNIMFLILVFLVACLPSGAKEIDVLKIIHILFAISAFMILFVLLEFFLRSRMNGIISIFLKGEYLSNELKATKNGYGFSGLASSSNVITFSSFILIGYSVFFMKEYRKLYRLLLIILASFIIFVVGERSNLLFLPISLMLTYYFRSGHNKAGRALKIMIGISAIIIIIYLLSPFLIRYRLFARIFESISTYFSGGDISNGRAILYSTAIKLWKRNPVFGNGWFYFFNVNYGILRRATFSHVHNLYLELLCDCGIVGTIIILIPFVYLLLLNIAYLKKDTNEYKGYFEFTLAFQIFFFLDSILHVTFYGLSLITLYFLIIFVFILCIRKLSLVHH